MIHCPNAYPQTQLQVMLKLSGKKKDLINQNHVVSIHIKY